MKLAIGTAQFGLNYGIANNAGIVSQNDVKNILKYAQINNIDLLDTAKLYGNSESVIGSTGLSSCFKIVTKTINFQNINEPISKNQFITDFKNSLKLLNVNSIYGLLFHNANDLISEKSTFLWEFANLLKEQNLVKKIGVSVYDSNQIDLILNKFKIDLIQLPLNIYDQRLIDSGHLNKIKEFNIEIHARSIFLQGLLTIRDDELNSFFSPIKNHHKKFTEFLRKNNISSIKLCLDFIKSLPIDYAIIGLNNLEQLKEIIENFNTKKFNIDYNSFKINDEKFINPSNWKKT